jgi:hypothetical protein
MVTLLWAFAATSIGDDDQTGRIQGMLGTAAGQQKYVGRAVVFICSAKTGHPLDPATHQSLLMGNNGGDPWHAVTDIDSHFLFDKVPVGEYRLIAQSWSGTEGVPDHKATSEVVLLHGVAEGVHVRTAETTQVYLQPLGNGVLTIQNDPEEAGAFLFLSTAPMLGDPVLGFHGWGDDFVRHVVGVTHMSVSRATFIGLPDDKEVHVGLFCYDNVPGFGGGQARVGKDSVASIRIYAGWSNGHDEPPARLLPLVNYLENKNPSLPELMQLGDHDEFLTDRGHPDEQKVWQAAKKDLNKRISVPAVGDFRVIDVLAADAYKSLRAHHRQQREQRTKAVETVDRQ